jgi:Predicted membrane protein (DUF2079)
MLPLWSAAPPGDGGARQRDRWDWAALAIAGAIAVWVFVVKLAAFLKLSFTSDLFVSVQLARSWLEGRFLEDNCFGRHLEIHTYFLLLPLGLLAKPFGAPGLFVALAAAVGAVVPLAHGVLRRLGLQGPAALIGALGLLAMPVSLWMFSDSYGFHIELLLPTLALGLFYALLRESMAASLVMAVLVASVKEEMPLIAAIIATMVLVEVRRAQRRWHRPALAVIGTAALLLPVLLLIRRSQPHGAYAVNHFTLLANATGGQIHGVGSLFAFAATNLLSWLRFAIDSRWPLLFLVATLGTLLLRPWYAPLGFLTTGVAWLLQDDLLWAPRVASALAFWWCVTLLGIASVARALRAAPTARVRQRVVALAAAVAVASIAGQLWFVRGARDPLDLHLFRPSPYTAAERAQADTLFAIYRREARPEEPVVASKYLFRYAHDRNLFWLDRLQGRPRPIWILQDGTWPYTDFGLSASDYTLVGQAGRFSLLKRVGR